MILYEVSINIDRDIEEEWLNYMDGHIKDVLKTGHFVDVNFNKLIPVKGQKGHLEEDGEIEQISYVIEYYCNNLNELNKYQMNGASALIKEHSDKFDGSFDASRQIRIIEDQFKKKFFEKERIKNNANSQTEIKQRKSILPFNQALTFL